MNPEPRSLNAEPAGTDAERRLHRAVLRLVKGGPERRAIAAGQADAILDPESGQAFLLPGAQRWLLRQAAYLLPTADSPPLPAPAPRAILDGLAAEICVLDEAGVVVSTNRAWQAAARDGLGAGVAPGDNYLASCDNAQDRLDGIALAAGIRQVLAGERRAFRYEHACGAAPARRWFTFNVTPVGGASAPRALVLREDITGRKRDEALLGLEYAVARALAEAGDAATALKAAIRCVCEAQGWDCGRYFRFDPAAGVLHCHASWGIPAAGQFLEKSRGVALHPNAGLKGRVYRSGEPLWVVKGTADVAMAQTALAPESDEDGGFFFPVTWGNTTLGVLAFSGPAIGEPHDRLLQAVRAIGAQLGQFLQRQQALDALRRDEVRFRRLTVLSTDWYWELDRDLRYTEYAGTGVVDAGSALGQSPWDLRGVIAASADWVSHQAQLGERWSFCDFEFTALRADGDTGYYSISGEPVFDAAGSFTGYWGTGMDITRRKRAEIERLAAGSGAAAQQVHQ